jgi:phosphotriesterase-related protein
MNLKVWRVMRTPLFVTLLALSMAGLRAEPTITTTSGEIDSSEAGLILAHEHIFTDLRGPDQPGYGEADPADVIRVMKPLLLEAKKAGVNTFVECTTIGVGRNVGVIARLARETGLNIVVPTGVYGRAHFAPKKYADMTEDQLAQWMMGEIVVGIENSGVRAGFIKTAASEKELRPLEAKFLRASARAALQTGVAIASHTTAGSIARLQVDLAQSLGLAAHRFIWVHAQAESNLEIHKELARRGVYIELDSVGGSEQEDDKLIRMIHPLLEAGLEDRILLSHDAGWYNPGQSNGGKQRGFIALTSAFIPKLKRAGLSDAQVRKLTRENPFRAFAKATPVPEEKPGF